MHDKKKMLKWPVMCCLRWERMSQVQERDCLCVEHSHQDVGEGTKERGDFRSGQGDKRAGRF